METPQKVLVNVGTGTGGGRYKMAEKKVKWKGERQTVFRMEQSLRH